MAAAVALSISSCEHLYDYEGDCDPHYYIKFEYTMHMEYADAFKEQVQAVDLWIFEKATGKLVQHKYSTVEDLKATDYLMPVDVDPGEYNFVAWCGHINNQHFKFNENISEHTHATCRLDKRVYDAGQATSDEYLDLLFHGKLNDAVLPTWKQLTDANDNGEKLSNYKYTWDELSKQHKVVYTIPLIRDVNNILLTLQHISGDFDTKNITVTMTDNNGSMLHDNALDESDEVIEYRPWAIRSGNLENEAGILSLSRDENDGSYGNFLNIGLSTSRLMADHNPIINISDNSTGKTMFSIPLNKWVLQLRSPKYSSMDPQEYLDRRNEHELMVILQDDGDGGWFAYEIVVNGWHVINNGEFEL